MAARNMERNFHARRRMKRRGEEWRWRPPNSIGSQLRSVTLCITSYTAWRKKGSAQATKTGFAL